MDAAAEAGFRVLPRRDFAAALSDRSVDAVCVDTAAMVIDACRAGKDVWMEAMQAPVCGSIAEGRQMVEAARRSRRVVQAGTFWRSSRPFQEARRAVRHGELGEVVFCRAFESGECARPVHLMDLLQFTFDEAMPVSAAAQGSCGNRQATFRYPAFVASYESRGAGEPAIAFHGARATRIVSLREDSGLVDHWRNFLECIRSRRKPVSDIETAVRSAATGRLMERALGSGTPVSFPREI